MAVTAKDVAEACGVSRITVNRALSGNENVKPETREKILKKAQEMGYIKLAQLADHHPLFCL